MRRSLLVFALAVSAGGCAGYESVDLPGTDVELSCRQGKFESADYEYASADDGADATIAAALDTWWALDDGVNQYDRSRLVPSTVVSGDRATVAYTDDDGRTQLAIQLDAVASGWRATGHVACR